MSFSLTSTPKEKIAELLDFTKNMYSESRRWNENSPEDRKHPLRGIARACGLLLGFLRLGAAGGRRTCCADCAPNLEPEGEEGNVDVGIASVSGRDANNIVKFNGAKRTISHLTSGRKRSTQARRRSTEQPQRSEKLEQLV